MSTNPSPGAALRNAVASHHPLQIVGVINAYAALLAQHAGFNALYLSGAGVANASHGLPDLGVVTLDHVLEDARRITSVTNLPFLVDADTGWGNLDTLSYGVRQLTAIRVAGIHLEDQIDSKRCGHRPGKQLCSTDEMIDRIRAATSARSDNQFIIMARTDAAAVEGLPAAIHRANLYINAGADMIFAEALTTPAEFKQFTAAVNVPVLANITEFGKTPLLTTSELRDLGVAIALYPLSAFRAASAAALHIYETIAREGTQKSVIDQMQTRDELYKMLNYLEFERNLDKRLQEEQRNG